MKIAILSDAHDHLTNLQAALDQITALGAETLLFCGDFCAPPLAALLADVQCPIHVVFGNNDGDRFMIAKRLAAAPHVTLHGEHADIVIDGIRIGLTHYPFYADKMAKSGDFDLVCFGHDHTARIQPYGACLAVNPGCLNPALTQTAGFAFYETATRQATLHTLS